MGCSFEAARPANQCGNSNNNNKYDNNKKEQLTVTIKTTCSAQADIADKPNNKGNSNNQHKNIAYNYNNNNNNKYQQANVLDSTEQQQQQQETTIESVKAAQERQRQEEQQQHLRQRAFYSSSSSNSSKRDNSKQKDKHFSSSNNNKDGSNASNSHNKLLIYDNDSFDKKYLTATYSSCCRRLESDSNSDNNISICGQNCTGTISSSIDSDSNIYSSSSSSKLNSSNIAYNQFINSTSNKSNDAYTTNNACTDNNSITNINIASNTNILTRKNGCIDNSNTCTKNNNSLTTNNIGSSIFTNSISKNIKDINTSNIGVVSAPSENCDTSNSNITSYNYTNNKNNNKTSSNIHTTNSFNCNIPHNTYTSNNNNCTCNKSNICCQQQTQQRTATAAAQPTTVALATTTTPQHEQQQCERCCHNNVTTNARQLHGNTAHTDSNNNSQLQEMLLQARATLATQLASVSNSLCENLSYCCAAADAACVLLKRTKQQQRQHQQHLQPHRRRAQQSEMSRGCATQQQQQRQQLHCQQQRQQQHAPLIDDNSNNNTSAGYSASAPISACSYIGHNYYHLLRNSVSLYAASSVILVLCYLTTSTSATPGKEAATIDKHPIQSIDWSKFDESSSDKEILDLLLEKKRYDKRLLPPVNDEDFCCGLSSPDMAKSHNARRLHKRGTLTVNVNVLLLSLASPDESSLKYEVEFLLNQQWNDPRLQYGNKSHYDFLNALHHHDSIWTPDTYFIMHGDFKDPLIPMHFALRIYRNGTITYAMRRHLILSCQGSLHIFPFDDPKCSFSMESISYEEAQIKYVWKNDEATLRKSPSLTTLNAYLIKNQTTPCDQNSWRGNYSCLRVDLIFTRDRAFYFTTVFIPGIILVTSSFITFWLEWNAVPARSMIGNYSCLQVELTFTRDRAYYFTTVFIPGIILVTSSFITFWLEWNAVPARVMIGVTTMLNFFTTSNGFRSTLPVVSNLTAMNVWDGVCMCFIYASLLEFVCVNYVGRKRPLHNVVYRPGENPVTQRLPAVLSRIGVILASPLEIIEREFHAALSSEKAAGSGGIPSAAAGSTPYAEVSSTLAATMPTNARIRWEEQHGGIIGAAVQNLRARYPSVRRQQSDAQNVASAEQAANLEHTYTEPLAVNLSEPAESAAVAQLRRSRSMCTNTPPLIVRGSSTRVDIHHDVATTSVEANRQLHSPDIEAAELQLPMRPPRKKSSRSTSPAAAAQQYELFAASSSGSGSALQDCGEKRRDASAPNEIVACTTCAGSSSPCTHSANNGCATETCFVQVRKKEPPHPIRVAKTIDVIARITFPTAYAIFLIFFFVHYKGFS